MLKIVRVALVVVLSIQTLSLSAIATNGDAGSPQDAFLEKRLSSWFERAQNEVNVQTFDSGVQPFQKSFISYISNWQLGPNDSHYCESFQEAPCDQAGRLASRNYFGAPHIYAQLMPKACASENDSFCIERIIRSTEGVSEELELVKEINPPQWSMTGRMTTEQVGGDPANGIPSGGSESTLWKSLATNQLMLSSGNLYVAFDSGEMILRQFSLQLFDVQEVFSSDFQVDPDRSVINLPIRRTWNGYRCTYTFTGSCLISVVQDTNVSYEVHLRAPDFFPGWFSGRMASAGLETESVGSHVLYKIAGKPVEVPELWGNFSKVGCLSNFCPDNVYVNTKLSDYRPWRQQVLAQEVPAEIDSWQFLTELVGDKAVSMGTRWQVSLVDGWGQSYCRGIGGGTTGLFTSNAMFFSGIPPALSDGTFSYTVAGLHYKPDGTTPVEGTYDFIIQSDVARCLYGYSNAPISASVQVFGENGEQKVATTLVSEKDGWLRLSASGFTFSANEVRVAIKQAGRSQIRTLSNFTGNSTTLSSRQKAEIRDVLAKSDGNTKFICTGIRYYQQPMRENIKVRARAKAACDYAKSINPNFSYWYQTKTTQARSYNGKVMVVSKG